MHSLLATSFRRHESQFPRASKHRHHTLEPSQQSAPTSHFSLYVYDMPTHIQRGVPPPYHNAYSNALHIAPIGK
jgi:hypothetical protein